MRILLKNARVLTMMDSNIFFGNVIVKDNIIEKVTTSKIDETNFDNVIDCDGNLLMPGFKNCHTHSAMTFLRGVGDNVSLHDWLFNEIFPREANLHDGVVGDLAKVAFLEYLTSGITYAQDMYFFWDDFKKAAEEFGFRSHQIGTVNIKEKTTNELIKQYQNYNSSGISGLLIGLHAVYTTTIEHYLETEKILKATKSLFCVHACETLDEVENCKKQYGLTPIEVFNKYHLFDNGGVIYHGVYLSDNDIKILKEKNVTVVTCPASNMKLASGVADIMKLRECGINVAIGTDGPSSNNGLDMFKEMYLTCCLQKLIRKDPVSVPSFEILKMATVNGAIASKLDNAKFLAEGQLADIILLDLSKPSMQPINNILDSVVYAGSKDIVKMTMINGKILYFNGKFLINENISDIYKRLEALTKELCTIKK